jgi:hypothetical protein
MREADYYYTDRIFDLGKSVWCRLRSFDTLRIPLRKKVPNYANQ